MHVFKFSDRAQALSKMSKFSPKLVKALRKILKYIYFLIKIMGGYIPIRIEFWFNQIRKEGDLKFWTRNLILS